MTMETYHWERKHLTEPPTTLSIMRTYPRAIELCGPRIGRLPSSLTLVTTDLSLRCVRQTNW